MRSKCLICKSKLEDGEQIFTVKVDCKGGGWAILGFQCQVCKDKERKK